MSLVTLPGLPLVCWPALWIRLSFLQFCIRGVRWQVPLFLWLLFLSVYFETHPCCHGCQFIPFYYLGSVPLPHAWCDYGIFFLKLGLLSIIYTQRVHFVVYPLCVLTHAQSPRPPEATRSSCPSLQGAPTSGPQRVSTLTAVSVRAFLVNAFDIDLCCCVYQQFFESFILILFPPREPCSSRL